MRTILIVEDEKRILNRLVFWVEEAELEAQVLTASTYEVAEDLIKHMHIDLPILDINLTQEKDELGIKLATAYRKRYPYNPIIFQTVNGDYKYQSEIHKHVSSVVYMVKTELTQKIFTDALKYELGRLEKSFTKIIQIKQKDQFMRLDGNQVIYFEKVNSERSVKCFYYEPEIGEVKVAFFSNMTLKEIENLQNAEHLLRCSGSYIVNPMMIQSGVITGNGIDLDLKYIEGIIPMSRRFYNKNRPLIEGVLR